MFTCRYRGKRTTCRKLDLSFLSVGSGDGTQVVSLGSKPFYPLSNLIGQRYFILNIVCYLKWLFIRRYKQTNKQNQIENNWLEERLEKPGEGIRRVVAQRGCTQTMERQLFCWQLCAHSSLLQLMKLFLSQSPVQILLLLTGIDRPGKRVVREAWLSASFQIQ